MIWSLPFFSFFFFCLKDFSFISSFFLFDITSLFMTSISFLVFLLIFMFIFNFLNFNDYLIYMWGFFFVILLSVLCFCAKDPFYFILFLECSVLPVSILIFIFSKDEDKIVSIFFMIFINMLGSVPFMIFCVSFIFSCSFYSSSIFTYSFTFFFSYFLTFCFFFMLICKIPLFMLHFWLTKAHVSASASCSMFLASLMLKLGAFGLLKFSLYFYTCLTTFIEELVSFSIYGSLFFCFHMIRFNDLKSMVACSSILHMSLIFPMLCKFNSFGVESSLFMMVGHGIVSYFLFFLAGVMYELSMSRSTDWNKSFESLIKIFSAIFFFFFFLNLGLPPFINFFSELYTCCFILDFSIIGMFIFFFCMVLSVLFTMFMISKCLFGKKLFFVNSELNFSFYQISFVYIFSMIFCPFLM